MLRRFALIAVLIAVLSVSWAYVPASSSRIGRARQDGFNQSSHAGLKSDSTHPFNKRFAKQAPTRLARKRRTALYAENALKFAAPDKKDIKAMVSAAAFVVIDVVFRRVFKKAQITFPSSLGACGCLFVTLLALPNSEDIFERLRPGSQLLAKWLPVFFVPSLVTLPLADSIGTPIEIVKVASVIVGGFFFTLLTTAYSVVAVRKFKGEEKSTKAVKDAVSDVAAKVTDAVPKRKAFSDELFNFLSVLTISSGIGALATASSPLTAIFLLSTTLNAFVFGARLPAKFTKVVHPLVTCTALTWTVMTVFAAVTGRTFKSMLKSYTTGGGLRGFHSGAGDVMLFLLGPAVVSLAISMYERRRLMQKNLAAVGTAIGVSTFGGLFGTAFAVRFLEIASPYLRLSLLSRNITSPLAMAIASILGADVSLAVSIVVVTGLIGANFGASILDAVGIKDAVARGLGIGAAAHGLGTAAFANEKDAFPFAAIAMALTATAATVTVSIPFFERILVQLALG